MTTWPSSAAWVIGTLVGISIFLAGSPDWCFLLPRVDSSHERR